MTKDVHEQIAEGLQEAIEWLETSKAWRDLDIGMWANNMQPLGEPYQSIMDENTEDLYES